MFNKLLFLFFVTLSLNYLNAQATSVTISLDGSVNSFVTHAKLFGVTLYMMQNERTISKSITDNYGNYTISGKVNISEPIDLLISKPGYISKKVLFDISTLKINKSRADATNIELVEELIIELYELKQGVDLNFAKIGYAEKFTWDQPSFIVKPDSKTKSDLDKKVLDAYEKAETNSASKKFTVKAEQALLKKEYDKALIYYDSALIVAPKDTLIISKRTTLKTEIDTRKLEESKKREFDIFMEAGDAAFKSSNWTLAETKYNEAAKLYPTDQRVKSQQQKIVSEKQKAQEEVKNKASYDKAIQEANVFVNQKKYSEAIGKYNEALKFQPNQKAFIDGEIIKIKGGQSDEALEIAVKKDLKTASELANKSKLDEAIKIYKQAEPIISNFSNQNLINKYTKEVKEGIQSVQAKKDSEDQAYKAQLAKAQENYAKGPSFYTVAKNILSSDPMKSKINEPEVIELKDKISVMETYYLEKNKAYKTILEKKNEDALSQLNKTIQNNAITKKIAPSTEKTQLQKSIDSLNTLVKSIVASKTVTPPTPVVITNQLSAPGEIVTGNDPTLNAFNDMYLSSEKYKSQPLNKQQKAKDTYDYDNYFNSTLNLARQEDESNRVLLYANATEITRKEVQVEATENQYQQENKKLQAEKEVQRQNAESKNTQEQLSKNIDNWKDKTDYQKILTEKEIQEQYVAQIASINKNKAQAELNNENTYNDALERQGQQQQRIENIQYSNYKQDSLNRNDQEIRSNKIQKLMDYRDSIVVIPNNLVDENGIPFTKNKMTERVYKIKNSDDNVIKVIVRRVVVDKNGYGVVFEQITNESGATYYTRNGATIPDFIWFNESLGENVIKK